MHILQTSILALNEIFTFIPIVALIVILFYFSSRETRKSLEQTKLTQGSLIHDRDTLRLKLDKNIEEAKENRLVRLNELTKAAEFGRLSQGLFHDLMTPLTSIILHTEKLKESTATQKNLEKAVAASNRMAEYIKDIRTTLSHEETETTCTVREELNGVLHLLAYKARTDNIEIEVREKESCSWYGNPLKLRQIFSNLIANALDAFDNVANKKKKIEILINKDGQNCIIKIRDNGSGIAKENIERIFEPFFTTKNPDKGTGIGLSVVKSIVEKDLKGKIEVESQEGEGSTFTITFPVQNTDPASYPPHPHTPLPHE